MNYYTGILLNEIPTGFGGYTGIVLTNKGNNVVSYNISISDTVFESNLSDENTSNTLFLSSSNKYISSDSQAGTKINKIIQPNRASVFYILHKPFSNFENTIVTGLEWAKITIQSRSSCGTADQDIIIDATGQRVTGFQIPSKLGKFYGVKNYDDSNGYSVNFNWQSLQHYNYFTGFKVELSSQSNFSTILNTNYLEVIKNNDLNLPSYGNYDGFIEYEFSYSEANLSLDNDNLYARIQPINATGGTGQYTYATGFSNYDFELSDEAIYGSIQEPGYDFKFVPEMLYLTYKSNSEQDFDLYKYIVQNNNNSTDFSRYSGINIIFSKSDENNVSLANFSATQNTLGAINFVPTEMNFNTGDGGIFKIELEFENIGLYGYNGKGTIFNDDGTYNNPQNGGPIFNLDNFQIQENNEVKTIEYHIYKDNDSIFYAGAGGGQGLLITDTTQENSIPLKINGNQFTNSSLVNLINP